ncbi:uncharacterized protein A4U43_C04F17210, partial [Asparagus officinalis]
CYPKEESKCWEASEVYFQPDDVQACIVTCGGLWPALNTVIREIVCGLCPVQACMVSTKFL